MVEVNPINPLRRLSLLLTLKLQGNALLRISEILIFTPVSPAIGNGGGTLSFQRSYLPVLQVRFVIYANSLTQPNNKRSVLRL